MAQTNTSAPPCPTTSQKTQDGLSMLLGQAISESPRTQMTVGEMCAWIVQRLPTDSCHSVSVLQTLIHHSLTQNKAFRREEPSTTIPTTPTNPCASEIWTLQLNALQSNGPVVPAKRKTTEPIGSGISTDTNTNMKKSIDTTSALSSSVTPIPTDIVEDTPSPSPEDSQPRRSGRSRRPPKPKEAEDYITHSIHLTSRRHTSPTTPPTSPPPCKESEDPPPIKKRGSVKFDKHITTTIPTKEHPTAIDMTMRTPVEEPAMMTSPRVRRPPQNLSEFVSSEDFKAAPCGKRTDRSFACSASTPSSSSLSAVVVDGGTRSTRPERKDKKRSKSESNVSNAASHVLATSTTTASTTPSPPLPVQRTSYPTSTKPAEATKEVIEPHLPGATNSNPRPRPVSIPLSALSHSKRRSEDFTTCFQRQSGEAKKRQRRSQSVQLQPMALDHPRRDFPSRQEIYEQRRQCRLQRSKQKRGYGDDEDSDSDFDFLKEEEENYRMRILTAKRQLALTGRLGRLYESGDEYEDEVDDDEMHLRALEGQSDGRRRGSGHRDCKGEAREEERRTGVHGQEYERSCRAEGERIKLLMDPSVITYGFDSCDGQYILDYHQSPLFNNVTWPEFSDIKDLKGTNSNGHHVGVNDNSGHSHSATILADQTAFETHLSTSSGMDPALETNKVDVPLVLSSAFPVLTGCDPEVEFTSTDVKHNRHLHSDAEAKEWGLYMGQGGGPSIEGNTVMDRRLERQLSLSSLFSLLSAKQEPLKLIPETMDTEMLDTESLAKLSDDILEGVADAELLLNTGSKVEDAPKEAVAGVEEEEDDGQVEEFIGLSWCQ
ncbi:hypothetical protein BGZ52_002015 [Haplosporangium bisporale]|nr:hypothetical protein BGZ52_002015 [Haplosporangium bisporale]